MNELLDDIQKARDLVSKYRDEHRLRTRKWHEVSIGYVERLTDKPYAEWEQVLGVIVGHDLSIEVKPKIRNAVYDALGAAGLGHVPIDFIETAQPVAH